MGRPAIDLTGQRFGRLVVVERAENTKDQKAQWLCKCDCGKTLVVRSAALRRRKGQKSCGCWTSEILAMRIRERNTTHGLTHHRITSVFEGMHRRCEKTNHNHYKDYGGRGIYVCDEWKTIEPFYKWAMENGYEDGLQIDRINNDGPYAPWNCRWVTSEENHQNTRVNRRIKCEATKTGETVEYGSIRQASRETGVSVETIVRMIDGKRTYKHPFSFSEIKREG